MKFPLITVITPSYNQGKYIEETIQSVLNQQYPNLEYIVIDGGSTDNTIEIIKKYESKITYWESKKDKGQSHAINKGLKMATGEIVNWLNSDDLLYPGALFEIAESFNKNSQSVLIHGKTINFGEDRKDAIEEGVVKDLRVRYLSQVCFPQPAGFFKREILKEIGYIDETLHYGMDYDLYARISLNYSITKINAVISKTRFHKDAKTWNFSDDFTKDRSRIISRIMNSFNFTESQIKILKELNLYRSGEKSYPVTKNYNKEDLEQALLYFLAYEVTSSFLSGNYNKAYLFSKRIKKLNKNFYSQYKLSYYSFAARYLPKPFILYLRKLNREGMRIFYKIFKI